MSRRSNKLVREASALVESIEHLRSVLQQFARLNVSLQKRIAAGGDLVTTLESLGGPERRREMTEALEEFETSRHHLRLAMFALAEEQEVSISEVARSLGISRQLASRLAAEADVSPGRPAKR